MAEFNPVYHGFLAKNDVVKGDIYKLVKLSRDANFKTLRGKTSGKVEFCNAETDTPLGILDEDGPLTASKRLVRIREICGGVGMVRASAAVQAGQIAVPAAGGKVAGKATINDLAAATVGIGIILEDAAQDALVPCLFRTIAKS